MTEQQKLEERFRAARSPQEIAEIADIAKQQTHWVERTEGSMRLPTNTPWTTPIQVGRARVFSERDGHVELDAVNIPDALKIDPKLVITEIGADAELQRQISEITDPSQLQQFLAEQNRQQK